jgi:hypothetical protein
VADSQDEEKTDKLVSESGDRILTAVKGQGLCCICDMVLFVIDGDGPNPGANPLGMRIGGDELTHLKTIDQQDWDHLISERGDRILTAVKGAKASYAREDSCSHCQRLPGPRLHDHAECQEHS